MKQLPLMVIILLLTFGLGAFGLGAVAQRGGVQQHRGNSGRIPPAPPAKSQNGKPDAHTYPGGQVDTRPHVANDRWYGHEDKDDPRLQLAQPYAHGHFEHFGPTFRYRVGRFDVASYRFWFTAGFGFEIAAWDWPFAADWCWACPDDIVVYIDPDHIGWYLIYNTETGGYVHAQYLGI